MNRRTSTLDFGVDVPDVWLRPFFSFHPGNMGYIGWTVESGRSKMLREAKSGDLMLIYGAGSRETRPQDRRRLLGFLQIDLVPIRDVERASTYENERKVVNGWQDRWTFALPVRRAWEPRVETTVDELAPTTYRPALGRSLAAYSQKLTPEEVRRVLALPVAEVDVFGEPPVGAAARREMVLAEGLSPSRGVTPSFGTRRSEYVDGNQRLYIALFEGDAAALLTSVTPVPKGSSLVKIGYTNDPERREGELNQGFPPAVRDRWRMWHTSAACPDGATALALEDELKARCSARFQSLGGEFFLADLAGLRECFDDVVRACG